MREMQALVRNYVLNRDRQMKYLAVLIALSLFVSFMVPFILMQPADSMAEASACGIEEHVHTEEAGCYQLFCAPEEGEEHVHSERCYALICEKIVHTHTPNCYPTKPDFSALFSTIYDPENLKATADGQSYANSPNDKPSEYKAPAGSILGVATHFHIFAESVSLQSHVHGNIATNWLLQNGAFGVYNDRLNGMSSINYIRNLGPNGNLDNAYQTQLIMGSDYSSPPSPWFSNRYEIRSKKDRKTYYIPKDKFPMWFAPEYVVPQVKFEKKDRPFINITQELNKFAEMSMDLVEEAQKQNLNSAVTVTENGENLILDFSNVNDKYIYYTIDATKFGMTSPWSSWMKVLQIKGITEDKFLFLNIDVGTNPDAYFSKSWMVYKDDGTTYGTGEVPLEDGGCRVLYNIVSSDGNGGNYKPFEGKAVFGERRNGSILAPNADVNVAGNTNGTIIARNFVATGESHRCDIQQEGTEGDDADWSLGEDTPKPPQPKKIEITVQKEWSGQQLGQVKVYLYKSTTPNLDVATANLGTPHKEATLSSGNSWQTVFTDLPAEEAGKTLYYYVKEETLNNYTATYDKNGLSGNNGTVKITNVEQVQNITVSVEKKWDHPSGSSTSDITVILYKSSNSNLDATKPDQFTGNDATVAGTATLNSSNNWNATFNNLPAKENGNTLYYYIVEQNVPENYTVSYTGNGVNSANGKVTVTNAKGKMVSVTAKKQWKPSVPSNAIPVKVKLYQSKDSGLDATKPEQFSGMKEIESATLSASNNWTCKFKEYPAANAKGEMYYYYIVESPVQSGYSAIYTNNGLSFNDGEIVVTNVKDITVTAKKIWDPDTVASTPTTQEPKTYKIMPIGDSITQGETGGGAANGGYRKYLDYIFDVKYEEYYGKDKTYDIDLVGPKNNIYPFSFEDAADEVTTTFPYNGVNVEHTYDNNHGGYSAMKIKDVYNSLKESDESGNLGSISKSQPDIILLMIGSNDKTAHRPVGDCETDLRELMDYIIAKGSSNSKIFLASIPEFTYAGGNVNENAEFNNMVKRVAQSYANSGKNVDFVDVHSWLNLDDLNDGIHPGEGGYEKMGKNWATVIDSYIQELQPVSSVPAETREPINVRLYKSQYGNLDATNADHVTQMQEVASATLNSDNGWTGKFEGLPAMENGSTLYYYVVEEGVPQYYTATYTNNAVNTNDGTVVVTNTKEKMLNITLDKEWVGGKPNNENITVTLYQSTERNLDMTVSDSDFQQLLNSNKLWKYSDEKNTGKSSVTFTAGETPHFTNLPVYNENGTMYYYYVRESDVSGYKPSYSKNPIYGADKEVTITNTKMISVSVTKNWQITTNLSTTPIEVVIYKYKHIPAEGEMSYWPTTYLPAAATPIKLADGETDWTQWINGNGTVTFENLPVEEDGYKLFYYIVEKENAEVTKNFDIIYGPDTTGQLVDFNQPDTYDKTITNKEKAATEISITVNKDWDVEDFFYDFDKDGTMDPPNDYYVQDSVNPVEQWADPIKVTLQYSTDGTNWTDYERYKDVEFYTTYTFTNLPKTTGADNTGSPYYYRVVESYNYGYVTEYKYPDGKSNINASEIQKGQAMPEVELKNTLLKRTLNVKKNWYNNINDGVDKVVVEIYRRTSTKKPDLGINPDGTLSGGGGNTTPDNPNYINSFDNGTAEGWTEVGNHDNGTNKSGLQTDYTYDNSPYSYGIISQNFHDHGEAYRVTNTENNTETIYYYNAYIKKDYTTSQLVPGQTYKFSIKVMRNSTTAIDVALRVKYNNDDTRLIELRSNNRGRTSSTSGEWVEISSAFTVPQDATSVELQIVPISDSGNIGTMLYVDDVKVTQVGASTSASKLPSTFENGNTDGWTLVSSERHSENHLISEVVTTNKSDGPGAYQLWYHGTLEFSDQSILSQYTSGNTYSLSMQCNRTPYAKMVVYFSDGTSTTIDGTNSGLADQSWQQFSGEFTVPQNASISKIQVGVDKADTDWGLSGSRMLVDDINITLVSSGNTGGGSTEQPTEAPTNPPSEDVPVVNSWTFEQDGSQYSWGVYGNGGDSSSVSRKNANAAEGSYCFEMSIKSANSGINTYQGNLVSQGVYKLSAQVSRGESSAAAKVYLKFESGGQTIDIASCDAPTWAWKEVSGTFTVPMYQTGGSLYIITEASDGTLAVDNIQITGPYPSSNSKPRNVETFFTDSETLTKRQLNVQMLDSNKLAKAEADADTSFWMDYEFPYRDMSANGGDAIVQFSDFREGALVGKTVRGIEIEFMTNGYSVPNNANMWFSTATYSSWGGGGSKGDDRIYVFESDHVIKDNDSLTIRTHVPEMIKRVRLSFSDGCTLTINNIKSLTEAMHTISGNYSKDVTLKNGGDWVGAWDINDSATELSYRWAGKKITSADVYFEKDYTTQGELQTDLNTIANTTGNPSGVEITKYGMYLLINGTATKVGNAAADCNWNDKEVRAQGLSFNTGDANYDIATFNFNNCPTIEDPKQTQVTENNVTTITKDYLSTVIMKVADATKVKAVVLNCENGETFVLNNTQYTTTQTTESKRVYHDFAGENGSTSFSLSGWDEEQIVGVDVYRKKDATDNSFSFNNDNNSISYYQQSNKSFNSVLNVVKYTLNNPTTISKLNVNTGNPYAIEKLVLVGKSGAKYVVANTAYASGVGNYQKWYPFEYSGSTAPRYNNMILSVDQLGRDMGGRKISKVQIYMNRTAIPTNESTGQNATNTFLQDPNAPVYPDENVQNPSAWEGRLSNKGRNGDSNEECTVVGGRKGLCDIHEYTILTDGPYQYDGIANAKFNGDLNTTNPWTGDALNIWTNNPEDISRVVVQFEDGTSYTVWNMYYVASSKLEYGHETSFTANGKTDLFTGATNIHRYNARTLDHIVVTYGENGERFASIPQDLLQYGAQESDKENISIGEISITHTFAKLINKQAVLKINDEDDDFTLANIKEIKLFYDDGYESTYTITNTDYSPKAPADTPAIGNQPALGSDFVFITTLDLTKENGWKAALDGLPVTDGQGNAYEYVIVEKNVYGEGADRYQLVSYEHPDGVILEKDGTQTSFLNTTTDEENGLVIMPSSGGEGKTWFYVAGVALMLCGIAGCYGMKRRQRSRR